MLTENMHVSLATDSHNSVYYLDLEAFFGLNADI